MLFKITLRSYYCRFRLKYALKVVIKDKKRQYMTIISDWVGMSEFHIIETNKWIWYNLSNIKLKKTVRVKDLDSKFIIINEEWYIWCNFVNNSLFIKLIIIFIGTSWFEDNKG